MMKCRSKARRLVLFLESRQTEKGEERNRPREQRKQQSTLWKPKIKSSLVAPVALFGFVQFWTFINQCSKKDAPYLKLWWLYGLLHCIGAPLCKTFLNEFNIDTRYDCGTGCRLPAIGKADRFITSPTVALPKMGTSTTKAKTWQHFS